MNTAPAETLDEALDWFDHTPSDFACAVLLAISTEYHRDGMIEDGTYNGIVLRVADWLRDEEPLP